MIAIGRCNSQVASWATSDESEADPLCVDGDEPIRTGVSTQPGGAIRANNAGSLVRHPEHRTKVRHGVPDVRFAV